MAWLIQRQALFPSKKYKPVSQQSKMRIYKQDWILDRGISKYTFQWEQINIWCLVFDN